MRWRLSALPLAAGSDPGDMGHQALASGSIARQGILAILIDDWRRAMVEIVISEPHSA
jgi:hypothetical protein